MNQRTCNHLVWNLTTKVKYSFLLWTGLWSKMERRFGDNENNPILKGIAACHPDSTAFLDMDVLHPLIDSYNINTTGSLSSQIDVCKLLMKKASEKPMEILDVISLLKLLFHC